MLPPPKATTDDVDMTETPSKTKPAAAAAAAERTSASTAPPLGIRYFFIFFSAKMECLLCYFKSDEQTLKAHYERVHRVDPTNLHFKNLFTADANKNCRYCGRVFADSNQKKKHVFLRHYRSPNLQQVGGSRNTYLNILRRGKIIEFSINFEQHKNHYNFFNAQVVPRFLDVVYQNFKPEPNIKYKFHGYFEILNWRSLQETYPTGRAWFTHVYRFSHFNGFVRQKMREEMQSKIINNGLSGSSWHFFRFESLKVIVVPLKFAQAFFRT